MESASTMHTKTLLKLKRVRASDERPYSSEPKVKKAMTVANRKNTAP